MIDSYARPQNIRLRSLREHRNICTKRLLYSVTTSDWKSPNGKSCHPMPRCQVASAWKPENESAWGAFSTGTEFSAMQAIERYEHERLQTSRCHHIIRLRPPINFALPQPPGTAPSIPTCKHCRTACTACYVVRDFPSYQLRINMAKLGKARQS